MSKIGDGQYRDNNSWETPVWLVRAIERYLGVEFHLDPAATERNKKAPLFFDEAENGLERPWFGNVFVNPPWGKHEKACGKKCRKLRCQRRGHHIDRDFPGITAWAKKIVAESGRTQVIACVLPTNNTDSQWFHVLAPQCRTIVFLKGRVPFELNGIPMRNNATSTGIFILTPEYVTWPKPEFWDLKSLRE